MKKFILIPASVCLTCCLAIPQTEVKSAHYYAASYSADWRVVNSGGNNVSTPRYSLHSSIGEAFVDGGGSGFYSLGSGYICEGSPPTPASDTGESILPISYSLAQNYPNPFNETTTIKFMLPERSFVTIRIYNVLGQLVSTLVSKEIAAGPGQVKWDGTSAQGLAVASGIYFCRLTSNGFDGKKKMLLLK